MAVELPHDLEYSLRTNGLHVLDSRWEFTVNQDEYRVVLLWTKQSVQELCLPSKREKTVRCKPIRHKSASQRNRDRRRKEQFLARKRLRNSRENGTFPRKQLVDDDATLSYRTDESADTKERDAHDSSEAHEPISSCVISGCYKGTMKDQSNFAGDSKSTPSVPFRKGVAGSTSASMNSSPTVEFSNLKSTLCASGKLLTDISREFDPLFQPSPSSTAGFDVWEKLSSSDKSSMSSNICNDEDRGNSRMYQDSDLTVQLCKVTQPSQTSRDLKEFPQDNDNAIGSENMEIMRQNLHLGHDDASREVHITPRLLYSTSRKMTAPSPVSFLMDRKSTLNDCVRKYSEIVLKSMDHVNDISIYFNPYQDSDEYKFKDVSVPIGEIPSCTPRVYLTFRW